MRISAGDRLVATGFWGQTTLDAAPDDIVGVSLYADLKYRLERLSKPLIWDKLILYYVALDIGDRSVVLAWHDRGFLEALKWLADNGWRLDEAYAAAMKCPLEYFAATREQVSFPPRGRMARGKTGRRRRA